MKINSLTEQQNAEMPKYVTKWKGIGLDTGKCDLKQCVTISAKAYEIAELPAPKYSLGPFNNPLEAGYAETFVDEVCDGKRTSAQANKIILAKVKEYFADDSNKDFSKIVFSNQIYGSMDASWLSFYDFFLTACGLEECKPLVPLMDLSKVCGWWTPLENAALFQHKPKAIHFDDRDRIHNENGPAIEFRGSAHCNVYAIHGVIVNKNIVDKNFTVEDIEKQTNIEVRRVMIDIYGRAKYVLDSGAAQIHSDDWGTLYVKEQINDVSIMMVKVANATEEPDGTFKDYFIRVDPTCYGGVKTAKAAVASTWRNPDGTVMFEDPNDYDPAVQT